MILNLFRFTFFTGVLCDAVAKRAGNEEAQTALLTRGNHAKINLW
jgi:hypothetical protein